MRIEKIHIRNFGPHESLEVDCDTGVFGLLGPNGSGKSNLLEAVKFAFTGKLNGNQNSYVRGWGKKLPDPEDGATTDDAPDENLPANGSVRIWFRHDGHSGELFRQVGKSPRRELKWDGQVLNRASEVDKILSSVFGSSKEALTEAVFMSQGRLTDFLFGSPSERETLFQRIFSLGYMPNVSDIAAQRARDMLASTVDLTAAFDEARAQRDRSMDACREAEMTWRAKTDPTEKIGLLENLIDLAKANEQASAELSSALSRLRQEEDRLASVVFPKGHDVVSANDRIEHLSAMISKGASSAQALVNARAQQERRNNLGKRVAEAAQSLTVINSDLNAEDFTVRLPGMAQVERLPELLRKLSSYRVARDRRGQLQAAFLEAQEKYSQAEQRSREADRALSEALLTEEREVENRLKADLPAAEQRVAELSWKLKTLSSAKMGDSCPLCGHDLEGACLDLEQIRGELSRMTKLLEGHRVREKLLAEAMQRVRSEKTLKDTMLQIAERDLEKSRQELDAAPADPGDFTDLETSVRQLEADEPAYKRLSARKLDLERSRDAEIQRMASFHEELAALPAPDKLASLIEQLESEKTDPAWEIERAELKAAVDNHGRVHASVLACQDALRRAQAAYEARKQALDSFWEVAKDKVQVEVAYTPALTQALVVYRKDLSEWQAARGYYEATVKMLREAEGRLDELREKQSRQDTIREAAGILSQVAQVFSSAGLPRQYIGRCYELLVEETASGLESLDANFSVELDPENPVNMLFWRVDDLTGTRFDQSKLSGGQRVRLSVAFLLAVQKLVLTGLNFLVLDEPSTHLDAEGVENLGEFLEALSRHLEGSETQVIVCDHHPSLQRAFSKCLVTGKAT